MGARVAALVSWGALVLSPLLAAAQSCGGQKPELPPPAKAPPPTAALVEVWVDAQAKEGGDGSPGRPLRQLEAALERPAAQRRVHLAAGLYQGPFVAADGTEVVSGSAAVLTAPAGSVVLDGQGVVRLEHLYVQGGATGIKASGQLRLVDVRFSGQREVALRLGPGGALVAEGVLYEASVSEAVGLSVEADGRVQLSHCTFEGPWRRAIEAHAPHSLTLSNVRFRGPVTALHLQGGAADVSDVTISEGRGPGLYVVGGRLGLHRVQVSGQEYGLLTGAAAVVEAEDFTSARADRAGVALVSAQAHFRGLTISSAGSFGGLQSISSEVRVERLQLDGALGPGLFIREGSLQLDGGVVSHTRELDGPGGDGVQVRGGRASFTALTVRDAAGACLLAANGAHVTLSQSQLERCRAAGLVVDGEAQLVATGVSVHASGGPGAVATGAAELTLGDFRAESTDGVVWAECNGGAHVTAWQVRGLPVLPCVQRLAQPPRPP